MRWINGLRDFVHNNSIKTVRYDDEDYFVMYKAVRKDFGSWHVGSSSKGAYRPGTLVECSVFDTSRYKDCGKGLHVSTLRFASQFAGKRAPLIVEILVRPRDIVCVPFAGGKVRCRRLIVSRLIGRKAISWNGGTSFYKWSGKSWLRKEITDSSQLLDNVWTTQTQD